MASYSMEDFIGNGALKELVPKLLEEGWDDVPTLKIMNSADMNAINMSQQQKEALEIRLYLHDCALMQYADMFEASGKCLSQLLNMSTRDLSSQFGMKKGHIARWMNRAGKGTEQIPKSDIPEKSLTGKPSRNDSIYGSYVSVNSGKMQSSVTIRSSSRNRKMDEKSVEQSLADFKLKDGYVFKGIVAAGPAHPRVFGCVQPPPVANEVAPYSAIENISIWKLTPEYKIGMEHLVKSETPPIKASELWREKPAVLLCIRRPLFFDQRFFFLMHGSMMQVRDFWPRYWGGVVVHDRGMEFFKTLGGGKLLKDKFLSGFFFNPQAIANYKRAKAIGVEQNFKGEGEIKGGLVVIGKGRTGIAYQFIERNFGDWAPLAEVIEICTRLQNWQKSQ